MADVGADFLHAFDAKHLPRKRTTFRISHWWNDESSKCDIFPLSIGRENLTSVFLGRVGSVTPSRAAAAFGFFSESCDRQSGRGATATAVSRL